MEAEMPVQTRSVAIIGGGPGALVLAYRLGRQTDVRLKLTVFESSRRLGGKVITAAFDSEPIKFEAGAAELYDYSELGVDPLRELVDELRLSTRPMTGSAVVLDDHILHDDSDIADHFGTETVAALRSFAATARGLIGHADYYESDWRTDNADPLSGQTFAELLAAIPDEAARRYIQTAVHSDLATEPHQTDAAYGLQNFLMNEPGYMRLYSIVGGIEKLVRALAEKITADVRLNTRVTQVSKTAGDRYAVTSRTGDRTQTDAFDFVVAALPNNWLPAIRWTGRGLDRAMHAHHVHYDYPAHYCRVTILFRAPFWRDKIRGSYFMLDAFNGCCVYDESARTEGTSRGILGWLIAGEAALNLANLPDAEIIKTVLDSLPTGLRHGVDLFLEGKVNRWTGSVNGRPGGRPMREPDSRHQPDPVGHPGLFVVGDYLFDSTLNGVVDSADTVAEWIVEESADLAPLGVMKR